MHESVQRARTFCPTVHSFETEHKLKKARVHVTLCFCLWPLSAWETRDGYGMMTSATSNRLGIALHAETLVDRLLLLVAIEHRLTYALPRQGLRALQGRDGQNHLVRRAMRQTHLRNTLPDQQQAFSNAPWFWQ